MMIILFCAFVTWYIIGAAVLIAMDNERRDLERWAWEGPLYALGGILVTITWPIWLVVMMWQNK